jgi:hypothetical protein
MENLPFLGKRHVRGTSRVVHMMHSRELLMPVHFEGAVRLDYLSTPSCILIAGGRRGHDSCRISNGSRETLANTMDYPARIAAGSRP